MTLPLIVEARALSQQLNDSNLLIIDLSSEENYLQGHIPGAIRLAPEKLLSGTPPIPNKLPSEAALQQLCQDIGLTPDSHVVAYDDQMGPWAGRLVWTLNSVGFDNCSVLDGQLNAWKNAGLALETTVNRPERSDIAVTLNTESVADIAFLKDHLGDHTFAIWDARSPEEYSGEKVINAQKGGHIPGAININWTDCLISSEDLRLKPKAELLALLSSKGITTDKTVITHCQTHRRSGLTYLVAKYLGFKQLRCYDGSWFEWGNQPDTPIEK
jgi:thiosulfate/3-mercaptopyruvate sulfurtransferase